MHARTKLKPAEKASGAVLDAEKVDMIGCPAGSPQATLRSAPRGMPAGLPHHIRRRLSVKDAFGAGR